MAHRQITLGDSEQAGQPRLRRQQIIKTRIELLLRNPIADVEQMPLAVVKKAEVRFSCQPFKRNGQRQQAPGRLKAPVRGQRLRIKCC